MFIRTQRNGERIYLMIAENEWVQGRVRQRVLQRLGRLDVLQQSGQLDGLMLSLQRFSERLAVLNASGKSDLLSGQARKIGAALVFERLWRELGIERVLAELLAKRQFEFSLERAVLLTVLHRLFAGGSDRAAEKWKEDYRIEGCDQIDLHHLYRAMSWLGQELDSKEQERGGDALSPRCTKDIIEERLFLGRRDLFSGLSLVFFDTTSIYFEGEGGGSLGQYGHSKDHRPDLQQMVVGVVLDHEGNPVCSEFWPGNVTDVKTLVPVARRLQRDFGVSEVCLVADRGMVSAKTVAELEGYGWSYILGMRMRCFKEVNAEVLKRAGRYQEVVSKGKNGQSPAPLEVKEVMVSGRRYIVCRNEEQAAKDRRDREAIVASLREALLQGDKRLVGNKGYRRYLRSTGKRFAVDEKKIKAEERYDGKWVLLTNTDLAAAEVAQKYKELWMVESIFRSLKSLLQTRPIYHRCDQTIRGHVCCSFLALMLRKELQQLLAAAGCLVEWADVIRDLDSMVEIEITVNDKQYLIRSETKGTAAKVFKACGVALPPLLRQRPAPEHPTGKKKA